MKILITGGNGFIGTHLTTFLQQEGHTITIYDIQKPQRKNEQIEYIQGNILDKKKLDTAIKGQDCIIHLAAKVGRLQGEEHSEDNFTTNIIGTKNMLDLAVKHQTKKIIYAGTSEAYGEAQYLPIDEKHPTKPITDYGISKLAGEHLCYKYHHWHGTPVVCARFFNTYGPGEETNKYRGVIARLIGDYLNGKEPTVDLQCTRSFTYIKDLCEMIYTLINSGIPGELYNLGIQNEEIAITDLADHIGGLITQKTEQKTKYNTRLPGPMDIKRKVPNTQKLESLKHIYSLRPLIYNLSKTIDWYIKEQKTTKPLHSNNQPKHRIKYFKTKTAANKYANEINGTTKTKKYTIKHKKQTAYGVYPPTKK